VHLKKLKRAVFFTAFFLFGCSSNQHRINKAFNLAKEFEYESAIVQCSNFPMQIFYKNFNSKHAIIYLEGDGLVINRFGEIASNSTPTDPMAIRLAAVDNRLITKIIINRPFHYLKSANSSSKYWTTARYSPEVVRSIFEAIKSCQEKFHFETIELIAYSGGASVAFLLIPYFRNITNIISFAGNLDHSSWTTFHNCQPLYESLDPLEIKDSIGKIPQIHFVGTNDTNTTIELAMAFKKQIKSEKISIIPVDGFDHDSNWPSVWQEELKLK
jgi:hypothetical protein